MRGFPGKGGGLRSHAESADSAPHRTSGTFQTRARFRVAEFRDSAKPEIRSKPRLAHAGGEARGCLRVAHGLSLCRPGFTGWFVTAINWVHNKVAEGGQPGKSRQPGWEGSGARTCTSGPTAPARHAQPSAPGAEPPPALPSPGGMEAPPERPAEQEQRPSPPAPARERAPPQAAYHLKWLRWREASAPVVTQNENGPCPLLAVMNALLLAWKVKLPPMMEIVTAEQLMEYLGGCWRGRGGESAPGPAPASPPWPGGVDGNERPVEAPRWRRGNRPPREGDAELPASAGTPS
ncbi:ubiquitin carboxyl-terminal hydrolase MINDY-2-like [Crotalus adamanteus]|uniref:Ubiquitin carboxyl-terminal hydrolase n=1 Tax=Crotalus adamanteus TaxID=8729 RepID=A0AAW1AVG6_CROAD